MRRMLMTTLLAALVVGAVAGAAFGADGDKMSWTGINYTKWLYGTMRYDGSMYNFTTIPGEGYGDNGQATEFEMLFHSRPSRKIEVNGRIKSRFNQNQWTNFAGFGGGRPAWTGDGYEDCVGGDCGEFDPRSNEYIKLRGITVTITPGYSWLDRATIGSSDFGMFDPFTVGKIRYIDRDNGKGIILQGSTGDRKFGYDITRISLPRLWAGPNYNTGEYTSMDAAYAGQFTLQPSRSYSATAMGVYVHDIEVDNRDMDLDDGRDVRDRYWNGVAGLKIDGRPSGSLDFQLAGYYSKFKTVDEIVGASFGFGSFDAYPRGNLDDWTFMGDVNLNNLGGSGLGFQVQYFNIGSDYVSVMAARRESDVLLTEGFDGTFAYPGPANAKYGVFGGNPTVIGYGGWQGNAQQVATVNVDNEFTDFDEPMAQTVIGWKGVTVVPTYALGPVDLAGEFTYVDYNTNWQMWGDADKYGWNNSPYPTNEPGSGFGSFRNAYNPFQDRTTYIAVLKADYIMPVGNGLEWEFKFKYIKDEDLRINDEQFLPANTTDSDLAGWFSPPGSGDAWTAFDQISDDDKDMKYWLGRIGVGYQISSELHGRLSWEHYDVDMFDGTSAFQAYNLHENTTGQHIKNKLILDASYYVGGAEFGMTYEYNFGNFTPDVAAYEVNEANLVVNEDTGHLGFNNRFGGFVVMDKREFEQHHMKAYMKLNF